MASKILKGLAVAAGTCMAVGLHPGKRRPLYPDNNQLFDHLLDRLDLMEAHLHALEADSISEPRLAKVVDTMVSLRTSKLEKALAEQSGIITALTERAAESDANLQKLIAAVERLCERTDLPAAVPPDTPSASPFETHLREAIKRGF